MTSKFTMDEPQPRLLDETGQGVIGTPMDRTDGPKKVSGTAEYSGDHSVEGMAHGVLVRATISRGKVRSMDTDAVKSIEGVIDVITDPRLIRNPAQGMAGEAPVQPGDEVHYHGQPIALVVAESFEAARDGAQRLVVDYEVEEAASAPDETPDTEVSDPVTAGDFDAVWSSAEVKVDRNYTTPSQVAAAMEPHAALAEWSGDTVTLRSSLQMIRFNKAELADSLGIDPSKVRILAPFVGGGFGSKLGLGPEAVAAAVAAQKLGRPVRVVMPRQTVFDAILRRSETAQRVRFGAGKDGRITAISHDDRVSNVDGEGFAEPVSQASQFIYGADGLSFTQTLARIAATPTGSVRAPGEAVGMLAFEAGVDELADTLGVDPLQLRLENLPDKHPMDGRDYSTRRLADCLRDGAERFGWSDRGPAGSKRDGDWLIGMGMASAARANMLIQSAARVRLTGDKAIVETDMTDIGTGTYTILAQITAEMLGLRPDQVEVRLGDSDLPGASGSGGSFGASSAGSATFLAARKLREQIAEKLGCSEDDLTLQGGRARGDNHESALSELITEEIVGEASIEAGKTAESHFSAGFGAHFAEVAVNEWTGEVRVRRMLGVMSIGRILNEKTARSQALGGMIWGIGAALTEEMESDRRDGHIVTRDLANYHVPVHADVPGDMQVVFLEERDDWANPIQSKGVGELGISGAGAAVINAIAHATGHRVYDYPCHPDRVLAAMGV
ncbi:xanthine dehydrogenase family protein molybdopterin-binding subunit [Pelagovum pacificum]|uniref:Xanthine dehydrogenase family protein molybdopterin-binding subunit n=1 Tax=Pelagovum pacificum TaxID=2588711 RepID=A0A5C5GCZ3_9RHOB|nr:xanthine dehydrogenase family protein molybdopterin-binding subunit [Pelagovum pacificum]QQA44345.1 xanthine dehydrogenase family protein molybdopterin-binding subunit [Pelagovum pacificum]TNY32538.1 xanthine dehydrogenase family protein molybdopterin-binding subunit [Pelagovum pacificum]